MKISRDFKEFVEYANERDVRFLVVGGYAVAFHGHPRYTKDLDVWVAATKPNARRLLETLKDFGFASLDLEIDDFREPDQIIQLGHPPLRIDILTSVSGLEFDECYPTSGFDHEPRHTRISPGRRSIYRRGHVAGVSTCGRIRVDDRTVRGRSVPRGRRPGL